jgi:hypothetical protein
MGADAYVHVVDHDRYRDTVVPGLTDLIGGAGPTPWLDGGCDRLGESFGSEWRDPAVALRERLFEHA